MKTNVSTLLSEPWLRGTLTEIPAVQRAVLHALQLAKEDLHRWCENLSDRAWNAAPANFMTVASHVRHIARSIDRLLSYAEGKQLSAEQFSALQSESAPDGSGAALFAELDAAVEDAATRIRRFSVEDLEQSRVVGKRQLPTTVAGLLVHVAEHTQRHVGQAITTAKLVKAKEWA